MGHTLAIVTAHRGLTQQTRDALVRAVEGGLNLTAAAESMGLPAATARAWKLRDATFATAIAGAQARWEARLVAKIEGAAEEPRNWAAAAWLLERRLHTRWGRREHATVTVDDRRTDKRPLEQRISRHRELLAQLETARELDAKRLAESN